ncbi:hypothetical protein, partial [Vibrio diabolicus]|uniref:hypothetical protein n=1 Tax=Vibrio diabolicus TaxID=50719 RepID=UPI001BB252AD
IRNIGKHCNTRFLYRRITFSIPKVETHNDTKNSHTDQQNYSPNYPLAHNAALSSEQRYH